MSRRLLNLPEKAWFHWHQPLLLEMAKLRDGRDLLGIPEGWKNVVAIRPHAITNQIAGSQFITEFRTAPIHARRVRRYWEEVINLELHLSTKREPTLVRWAAKLGVASFVSATESTFHPDPHPEVDTVDGILTRAGVDEDWSTIHAGGATSVNDTSATIRVIKIDASTTQDQYAKLGRMIALFDTSPIDDGDTIDAATFSMYITAKQNGLSGESSDNSKFVICGVTPDSNTGLVGGDFLEFDTTDYGESTDTQADMTTSAYNAAVFNATGRSNVSKTDITKLGIRYRWDIDDLAPEDNGQTWASGGEQGLTVAMAETADTDKDPKLAVTHSAAGGGGIRNPFGGPMVLRNPLGA